jgi:hypothetical protein
MVLKHDATATGKTLEEIDGVFMKHPPEFEPLDVESRSIHDAPAGVTATEKGHSTMHHTELSAKHN